MGFMIWCLSCTRAWPYLANTYVCLHMCACIHYCSVRLINVALGGCNAAHE